MSDLVMDTATLRSTGEALRSIAQEFDDANANSDSIAGAIGHDGLAHAVHDFATGWDDKRAKMVDAIASLAQACTGIGENFEDLDSQFAAALRGEQ
ncbi:MAG TPA: hypothetical protein VGK35_14340 [Actinotalea sp.]